MQKSSAIASSALKDTNFSSIAVTKIHALSIPILRLLKTGLLRVTAILVTTLVKPAMVPEMINAQHVA